MPRGRPRRRKAVRRQGRGFVFPFAQVVKEGQTAAFTLSSIITSSELWQGVPWKITHITFTVASSSAGTTPVEPALAQVRLNSASQSNIESISSIRLLVSQVPVHRVLRMKRPNLWKEDEERLQNFLYLDNIKLSSNLNTSLHFYVKVYVLFGPIPFSNPSSFMTNIGLTYHHNPTFGEELLDDDNSVDSLSSNFSKLNLN